MTLNIVTTVAIFWSEFHLSKNSSPIFKQQHLNFVSLPHGLPYGINFLALKTRESSLQAARRPRSFVCQPCVSRNRGHGWRHKQSGPDWAEINPVVGACRVGRSSHTAVADCRCFCWRCCGLKCCCQVSSSQIEFIIIGRLASAGGGNWGWRQELLTVEGHRHVIWYRRCQKKIHKCNLVPLKHTQRGYRSDC